MRPFRPHLAFAGRGVQQGTPDVTRRSVNLAWQVGIVVVLLALWQWAWKLKPYAPWTVPDVFDPYFVSKPSDIWTQFLRLSCLQPKPGEWALPGARRSLPAPPASRTTSGSPPS